MNQFPIITILTFLPLLGGIVVASLAREQRRLACRLALVTGLVSLGVAIGLWKTFDSTSGAFQFEERHAWVASLGIEYRVAVDGLGLMMVLLTALVTVMAMVASLNLFRDEPTTGKDSGNNPQLYFGLMLFLESGLMGTFTALNFFHWFIFWELSLIPAFFLVRLWGGPQRAAAATQFFVYTMVGSIGLLLAFLVIFLATDKVSDFGTLADWARDGRLIPAVWAKLTLHGLTAKKIAALVFGAALLGFAVKVPLMPFHTWLPAAYTEAPAGTTMLLTGVMSKMGVYG